MQKLSRSVLDHNLVMDATERDDSKRTGSMVARRTARDAAACGREKATPRLESTQQAE
jgi:hypothetical protein